MSSLCAVLALAVIGNQIATREGFAELDAEDTGTSGVNSSQVQPHFRGNINVAPNSDGYLRRSGSLSPYGAPVGGVVFEKKKSVPSFGIIAPDANRFTHGKPVFDLRGRQSSGAMHNNVAPIQKTNVGPGLGIPASVPAAGGFHPRFRVMPGNVGAYRLHTAPGRFGAPVQPVARQTQRGAVGTQQWRPVRHGEARGPSTGRKFQDLGAVANRGSHTSLAKVGNRAATTLGGRRNHGQVLVPGRTAHGAMTDIPSGSSKNYEYAQSMPGVSSWFTGTDIAASNVKHLVKDTQRESKNPYLAPAAMSSGNLMVASVGGVTRQRSSKSSMHVGGAEGQSLMQRYVNDSLTRPNAHKSRFPELDLGFHRKILEDQPLSQVQRVN